jgi:hypothetical protein
VQVPLVALRAIPPALCGGLEVGLPGLDLEGHGTPRRHAVGLGLPVCVDAVVAYGLVAKHPPPLGERDVSETHAQPFGVRAVGHANPHWYWRRRRLVTPMLTVCRITPPSDFHASFVGGYVNPLTFLPGHAGNRSGQARGRP